MDGLDKLTTDDRFELLSAYVDNELSLAERKQVEQWLESDPEMQRQYRALSALSRSFQSMPAPATSTDTDELLDAVFTKVERKPRLLKKAGIGTAVIAAIGALGALFSGSTFSPQMASGPEAEVGSTPETSINSVLSTDIVPGDIESVDTDSLMLVLEAPPVDIPVVADPASFIQTGQ